MEIAQLSVGMRIILILVIVTVTWWVTEKLLKINSRRGKIVEQSGGLFIEYDHYWIWSWFKFPVHFVEIFSYFRGLETGRIYPVFTLKSSLEIAIRRCIWHMKYRPLHASPEQVLEYYRRVIWTNEHKIDHD